MQNEEQKPERLLLKKEVLKRVPFGKTTLHEKIKAGEFPRPRKLGKRVVAWREKVVDEWILNWDKDDQPTTASSSGAH